MKFSNIPFFLVFLSSLLPIVGALFNLNVYHMAGGFLMISLILLSIHSEFRKFLLPIDICIKLVFFLLICILVIQVLTGRGFVILASGGYVIIFSFIFLGKFWYRTRISAVRIFFGVSFLYKYFIIGIFIEAIIVLLGWQPMLTRMLDPTDSSGYKNYNSADVLRFFGLMQNSGGLNSVLLGSQIAGMLSLFSTIWFMGINKIEINVSKAINSSLWTFLSLLALLITINGTVFLLLAAALMIYGLLIARINKFIYFSIGSLLFAGIYYLVSNGFIFQRILNNNLVNLQPETMERILAHGLGNIVDGMTTFEYYFFEFSIPIYLFISLQSWSDILFGVGAQYFRTTNDYLSGDFGFGAALLSSGLVWMTALVFTLCVICFSGIRPATYEPNERKIWSLLGSLNGLISLLFLFSTIHYIQAFSNPGGMMLFSLHLALTSYCRNRFVKSTQTGWR